MVTNEGLNYLCHEKSLEINDLDCYRLRNSPNDNFVIFKNYQFAYVLITSFNEIIVDDYDEESGWIIDDDFIKLNRDEMQLELSKYGKFFDFGTKQLKNIKL